VDQRDTLKLWNVDPIDPLGPCLEHAGSRYELWIRRENWFLYRSEFNGTSFRHFIIIKAETKPGPDKNETCYWLSKAREDVNPNVCGPVYANCWVIRDKFMKLSKGETNSMTYRAQNRHHYQDRQVRVDLPALQRLSLADVFKALEGK
jgi:hypothetical protein